MRGRRAKRVRTKFDWGSVDWSLQDTEISRMLGCSKEGVRLKRLKLGMPQSPRHGRHLCPKPRPEPAYMRRARTLDTASMTAGEISKALKIGYGTACVKFPVRRRLKQRIDWSKISGAEFLSCPDEEVAAKLRCHVMSVTRRRLDLGVYRSKPHGKTKALVITGKRGHLKNPPIMMDEK